MKNNLIVLFGLPGCGKTTLVKEWLKNHSDYSFIEIFPYIKKRLNNQGKPKEESCVLKAHQEFYKELKIKGDTIIELGTNYPKLNIKQFKKITQREDINLVLVLCILDRDECLERTLQGEREIPFDKEQLILRLKRNYPASYQQACKNHGLNYYMLDMKKDVKENVKELEKYINQ